MATASLPHRTPTHTFWSVLTQICRKVSHLWDLQSDLSESEQVDALFPPQSWKNTFLQLLLDTDAVSQLFKSPTSSKSSRVKNIYSERKQGINEHDCL